MIGVTAYRTAFAQPRAAVGRQEIMIGGTPVWVLPNPSGLNAHWNAAQLAAAFGELREVGIGAPARTSSARWQAT